MAGKTQSWLYPKEAAAELQINTLKLGKLRRAGAFKEGHHYRDIAPPSAARPTYQYHVHRIEALFSSQSAKRKKYA